MAGVLALLGLVLVLLLGPPTFRAELNPSGMSLAVEASKDGLTLRAGGLWNGQAFLPQLSFAWTPQVRTYTITFTTDSLSCVLVEPGQVLREGDLIGYASLAARERIAWLEKQLPEVEDEVLRTEVLEEIERLRRENEIRALIPGRVLALEVEQAHKALRVRIQLKKP